MMRCSFYIFLALLAPFAIAIQLQVGQTCQTVNGKLGVCHPLKQCESLFNLLRTARNYDTHQRDRIYQYLRQSSCGFFEENPLVCCGDSKNLAAPQLGSLGATEAPKPQDYPVSSTEASLPTSTRDSKTQVQEDAEVNERQLLPEKDCGRMLVSFFFRDNATELGDFPWTALLEYDTPMGKRLGCGAVLISDRYVLTAAHCVAGLNPSWTLSSVRLGEHNLNTDPDCLDDGNADQYCAAPFVSVPVEKLMVHPAYLPLVNLRLHDIALLRLAREVEFNPFVQPICLPTKDPIPQRFITHGWGHIGQLQPTSLKYFSQLSLANRTTCASHYEPKRIYYDVETQFCAGIKENEVACIGDEGGALVGIEQNTKGRLGNRYTAFGLLSIFRSNYFGCPQGVPGIYVKVLNYVPWILRNLEP